MLKYRPHLKNTSIQIPVKTGGTARYRKLLIVNLYCTNSLYIFVIACLNIMRERACVLMHCSLKTDKVQRSGHCETHFLMLLIYKYIFE